MLKIERQTATMQDFLKLKKHEPEKSWRNNVGKALNFTMMFGAEASTFAKKLERNNFTPEDCDQYITLTNNNFVLNEALLNKKPDQTVNQVKYLVAAQLMRESFFTGYKGLMSRIIRERKFAANHGYIRTWHGPVRHLPEFVYMNYSQDTWRLIGFDSKFYSKTFSHALNQAANSAIQSGECVPVFCAWINIAAYVKEWHLKSFIWNSTHDSFDACVYKPEKELWKALVNACGAWHRPPTEGIYHRLDSEVSDVSTLEHRKHTFYKHGVEENCLPIEKAVEVYNKINGTNIKWHGCFI